MRIQFLPSDYLVPVIGPTGGRCEQSKTAPTVKGRIIHQRSSSATRRYPLAGRRLDNVGRYRGYRYWFYRELKSPLFFQTDATKDYYLYTGARWLKSASIEGPSTPAPKLPGNFSKVADNPKWADMKQPILSPSAKGKPPTNFYSNKPAEVMLFQGQPAYAKIPGTELSSATNADCDLFVDAATKQYYYLVAGRWFRCSRFARSVDLCDAGSTG